MASLLKPKEIITTHNASGASRAAVLGFVVVIVDVIDMSTSLEAALEKGAKIILGASPDKTRAPVKVNPFNIGLEAARQARKLDNEIIIISEPRWGSDNDRLGNCNKLIEGIQEGRGKIVDILPNIGAEVGNMTDFKDKIVVCVSDTGGVAFDAAWQIHQDILTGTIARTLNAKGREPAQLAAQRAIDLAQDRSIALVAASANSLEDVLAANYIAQLIIEKGYLNT